MDFAFGDLKTDVVQGFDPRESLGDGTHFKDVGTHGLS
jgi:hypothetical protein